MNTSVLGDFIQNVFFFTKPLGKFPKCVCVDLLFLHIKVTIKFKIQPCMTQIIFTTAARLCLHT